MNRRIAAVRGLFEFAVMTGVRADNPVPAARRSSGLRPSRRGLLGHIGAGRPRSGGRLVRQPRRLPESLEPDDVAAFLADLRTFRDRAITLVMLLGGLRAAEVRSLRLADVDMGLRRVRVTGKGGKERVVPVDGAFFAELAAYLREERPAACRTPECFVVLRGPTAGQPLTEAGLRRIFRTHRPASGAVRVRPHRLRHTYGTELASAGIDLLALRELMGHANPETTAAYVHLSPETLAAEYARARAAAVSAPAAVTLRRQGAPDLLVAYADAVAELPIGPDGQRIRRNAAARLLAAASAAGGVDDPAHPGPAGRPQAHRRVAVPELVFHRRAPRARP